MPEEVIDLCDSDSDSIESDTPELPSTELPESIRTAQTRLPDNNESDIANSNATGPKTHILHRYGKAGQRSIARSEAPASNKSKTLPANAVKTAVEAVPVIATAPAADMPLEPRSYWRKRPDVPSKSGTTTTPSQTTTIVESTTSAHPPATAGNTGHTKVKTKKRTPKPTPEHPHKYRGPELNVLSLQAIWDHLDRAWKQAFCNVTNIGNLQSWWNSSAVTAAHQLNKHQVWLLLFAQSKWWQALEEQWTKFDALPDKNRMVILKMRGVRLRKESDAIKAEAALVNDGINKNLDAVYMLGSGVKKEKVDEEETEKKGDGMKRTRVGDVDGEVQKEGAGVQGKRVKFASEEMANKGAGEGNKGTAENNESDDGLSSDSDEEEEED